jgi:hypothetical protein
MYEMLNSWPRATAADRFQPQLYEGDHQSTALDRFDFFDTALSSDLLADLTLPQTSGPRDEDQPSFGLDEDLFAHMDDFILFPDHSGVEIWPLEESRSSQCTDGATSTESSPVSSTIDCVSDLSTSRTDVLDQGQHRISTNTNQQRYQRRRRTATVFPCALCTRVCFTSVEARYNDLQRPNLYSIISANIKTRRHYARHVKPFKCSEPMLIPPHLQTPSRPQLYTPAPASPSTGAERSKCDKAFATKNELERHRKSVHYCIPEVGPREWYRCPIEDCKVAERLWPRRDNLLVHMKQAHPDNVGAELR